jgi:hypothetical protein
MKKGRETQEPSAASLREMPEQSFTGPHVRRNPHAARLAVEGIRIVPGRPKKGSETGATVPRSIRFPAAVWRELERLARAEGLTLHAALRAAVLEWMRREVAAR